VGALSVLRAERFARYDSMLDADDILVDPGSEAARTK
jgi:hypothetical protein